MTILRNNLLPWFLLLIILSPWFRHLEFRISLPQYRFSEDITSARKLVEWKRGKIQESSIASFFINWPAEFFASRMAVIMENIDIGNYFFAGHPRERVGVDERQKFFFFQAILFFIGFFSKDIKSKWLFTYLFFSLTLAGIFKLRDFEQTILLSFPFLYLMALGARSLYRNYRGRLSLIILIAILEITAYQTFYIKGLIK